MTTMRLTRLFPLFAVAFLFLCTYAHAGKITVIDRKMDGVKADLLKTYADSKVVQLATRDPSSEGNLTINLISTE